MREKIIAAAGVLVFVSVAWGYFRTPPPPVPGLVRPELDRSVFDAANQDPAMLRARERAERQRERAQRVEETQDTPDAKGGFLSRLTGGEKDSTAEPAAQPASPADNARKQGPLQRQLNRRPRNSPFRSGILNRNENGGGMTKAEHLAKRRAERQARREAMRLQREAGNGGGLPSASTLAPQAGNDADELTEEELLNQIIEEEEQLAGDGDLPPEDENVE
ncbi:hypothetical protein K8I61_16370 [bacterium]|nr:hypothetical protein [bacterium]